MFNPTSYLQARLQQAAKLKVELSVLIRQAALLAENGMDRNEIDLLILKALPLAEEIGRIYKLLSNEEFSRSSFLHELFDSMIVLLGHSNPEKSIRKELAFFLADLLNEANRGLSYAELNDRNHIYQWLRREGLEPHLAPIYGSPLAYPLDDKALDSFFMEHKRKIYDAMILHIAPQRPYSEPFSGNDGALNYFQRYRKILDFSPMIDIPPFEEG